MNNIVVHMKDQMFRIITNKMKQNIFKMTKIQIISQPVQIMKITIIRKMKRNKSIIIKIKMLRSTIKTIYHNKQTTKIKKLSKNISKISASPIKLTNNRNKINRIMTGNHLKNQKKPTSNNNQKS